MYPESGFTGLKFYKERARRARGALALGGLIGGVGLFWIGDWFGFGLCLLGLAAAFWLGAVAEPMMVEESAGDAQSNERPPEQALKEPLEMVELSGGAFLRDSYRVTVSPFAIGRYPITRGLYREIVGSEPDDWKGARRDDRLPANYVTWFDAALFCNALSELVGLTPCYRIDHEYVEWDREAEGYRLPTEAEWECAVRAGTQTAYFFGDDPSELHRYAWFSYNSDDRVHPIDKKKANPWGLHGMLGNVLEWCWDWYGDYPNIPASDPIGSDGGTSRVLRGGSAWDGPVRLQSCRRNKYLPRYRSDDIGFRCARRSRRRQF